jgi:hypothetical protein
MSAVVVALKTPYYGVPNDQGKIVIEHVPPGRYTMQVWADRASLEYLKKLNREVAISDSDHSLGVLRIVEDGLPVQHKNKYGRDYDAPGSDYPSSDPK